MIKLLDANVLFALGWSHHAHHLAARRWFDSLGDDLWATCLITQSAFLRLSLNPHAMNAAVTAEDALAILRPLVAAPSHRYLDHSQPLSHKEFGSVAAKITGYQQVTDATLLHVAAHHGATLVTFDQALKSLAAEDHQVEAIRA